MTISCSTQKSTSNVTPVDNENVTYEEFFTGNTMRFDFHHAGDSKQEFYYFDRVIREGVWAGSHLSLINPFDYGEQHFRIKFIKIKNFCSSKDILLCCVCVRVVAQLCPALCDPWTVGHQAPLSTELFRQEYWSEFPFPTPGIKPTSLASPALAADSLPLCHLGWHHRLNGHEFEWTPGVDNGQGSLACCSPCTGSQRVGHDWATELNCATWEAPILYLILAKRPRTKWVNVQVEVWERYLKYMCLVHIKNYKSGRKI